MLIHKSRHSHAASIASVSLRIIAFAMVLFCSALALAGTQQLLHIPRIPQPKSAPVSAALMRSLSAWDKQKRFEAQECARQVAKIKAHEKRLSIEAEFDLRYEVLLDTPTLYSVAFSLNVFCGGAHPDHVERGIVFDLTTGKAYDPLKLYAIASKGQSGYEFCSSVREMIRQRLLEKRGPDLKDDECLQALKDDDIRYIDDGIVALGQKGLAITYSGAHVVQACFAPVVLPYFALKGFLNQQEAARLRWQQ